MENHSDTLTGLAGRPALMDEIALRIGQRERFAVALIDIDSCARINHDLGHQQGDEMLKRLASFFVKASLGATYRIGGDEFALVLPQVTLEQALVVTDRLRVSVSETDFGFSDGRSLKITAGLAHFPRHAREAQALIDTAADALLYGKDEGGNQVALPPSKTTYCYYSPDSLRQLKTLAERTSRRETSLLREALSEYLRKFESSRPH